MKRNLLATIPLLVVAIGIGYFLGVGCEQDPISIGVEGAAAINVYEYPVANFQGGDWVDNFDTIHFNPNDDDTTPLLIIYGDGDSNGTEWQPLPLGDWQCREGGLRITNTAGHAMLRIVVVYEKES
ncbi:hypothetical protein K8R78_08160 [bacterium]|nr:hypothetical protein [bacterium]